MSGLCNASILERTALVSTSLRRRTCTLGFYVDLFLDSSLRLGTFLPKSANSHSGAVSGLPGRRRSLSGMAGGVAESRGMQSIPPPTRHIHQERRGTCPTSIARAYAPSIGCGIQRPLKGAITRAVTHTHTHTQ